MMSCPVCQTKKTKVTSTPSNYRYRTCEKNHKFKTIEIVVSFDENDLCLCGEEATETIGEYSICTACKELVNNDY